MCRSSYPTASHGALAKTDPPADSLEEETWYAGSTGDPRFGVVYHVECEFMNHVI